MAHRARQNQGYVPNSISDQSNNGNEAIWTTAYPPPSYDNIYESSQPVNPLPDYNSTLTNAKKEDKITKNESRLVEETQAPIQAPTSPDSYNVAYTNQEEIVTFTNPQFNPIDIIGDRRNSHVSDRITSEVASLDNLELTLDKDRVSEADLKTGQKRDELLNGIIDPKV